MPKRYDKIDDVDNEETQLAPEVAEELTPELETVEDTTADAPTDEEVLLDEEVPETPPRAPFLPALPPIYSIPGRIAEIPPPDLSKKDLVEDLSDMFEVTKEDVMGDTEEGMDDLTTVSAEDGIGGDADMSDLFDVAKEDITGDTEEGLDDLTSVTGSDDDLRDLMEVSQEDIMGPEPKPAKEKRKIRIIRRPQRPDTSFGGVQY